MDKVWVVMVADKEDYFPIEMELCKDEVMARAEAGRLTNKYGLSECVVSIYEKPVLG